MLSARESVAAEPLEGAADEPLGASLLWKGTTSGERARSVGSCGAPATGASPGRYVLLELHVAPVLSSERSGRRLPALLAVRELELRLNS